MGNPAHVERFDFGDGKPRKLKARHKFLREAVRASGKSIGELIADPFYGYPYLIQALLQPGSATAVSLDDASELIDLYHDSDMPTVGKIKMDGLTKVLVSTLSGYLHIEMRETPEEEADPNGSAPDAPGRSGG